MHQLQNHCFATAFAAALFGLSSCTSPASGPDRSDPVSNQGRLPAEIGAAEMPVVETMAEEVEAPVIEEYVATVVEPGIKTMGPWVVGDQIDSERPGVKPIEILEVHANGSGPVCGMGKRATLRYVAMTADGSVIDPGSRPFQFRVGGGQAIVGWDVVVSKMRVGDAFVLLMPQELAYGSKKGDLKFMMDLLSVE